MGKAPIRITRLAFAVGSRIMAMHPNGPGEFTLVPAQPLSIEGAGIASGNRLSENLVNPARFRQFAD